VLIANWALAMMSSGRDCPFLRVPIWAPIPLTGS